MKGLVWLVAAVALHGEPTAQRFVQPLAPVPAQQHLAGQVALIQAAISSGVAAMASPQSRPLFQGGGASQVAGRNVLRELYEAEYKTAIRAIRRVQLYADGRPQVALWEELLIQPANPVHAVPMRMRLQLIRVDGKDLDAQEIARRNRQYESHSRFLHDYRDFHVSDWQLATANYSVESRTGHLVAGSLGRLAVELHTLRPRYSQKSSYELAVEPQSGLVLRCREFDSHSRLVLETSVQAMQIGAAAQLPEDPKQYWRPLMEVKVHPDVEAAKSDLDSSLGIRVPDARQLPTGYVLSGIRTTRQPMSNLQVLVLEYTDGIDKLHVVQGRMPVLTGGAAPVLPEPSPAPTNPVIFRYREGVHCQCMAVRNGITCMVVGRVMDDQLPALLASML